MINRRLIRIKALQELYAYKKSEDPNFVAFYKEYEQSLHKTYEQYCMYFLLLAELKHTAFVRIDQIKNRLLKTDDEWLFLLPFAENKVLAQIEGNKTLQKCVNDYKLSWKTNENNIVKELFTTIIEMDWYKTYAEGEQNYANDKKFVRAVLTKVVYNTEHVYSFFEDSSLFWNDEDEYILSMVEKTLRAFSEENEQGGELMPLYKDEDIKRFSRDIFTETINNWAAYNEYIAAALKNWDQERIADIDKILLQMAVTEAIKYSEIPLAVTLNEYIEIAKLYSTDKSSIFINGILHGVFSTLQKQGIIVKRGRGLIK
ncbi:MAG: transcription antitermination protein NusB [Bacteroidales bacterium]|jgi:N utilization substance protein B|nr:transcription antitermination protein NusB [Bacteroidales bacterium]